ncbi:MAG: glycoside hydrolase family 2 TIM barrel-domain containing protein [Anaerolineae bacterium]|nr:hypothetical protein [Anaerolineae bacterium]MDW8099780.1 glycoside hydrolase family 2 TIM barrel-domain containing protein [Anaerolineae bacterium]
MADTLASRISRLLNGWWDFQPVAHPDLSIPLVPDIVPAIGWAEHAYLVPGFFTDHSYPEAWRASRSGWMRTRFGIANFPPNARAFLTIKAAIPKAHIFINGRKVGEQDDMFIGDELDVTHALRSGENELAVFLTEHRMFPHPVTGELTLVDVPWGCCITQRQAGIWQDVVLEWRPVVYIADITIVTSVREKRITITYEVRNAGDTPFSGRISGTVLDGQQPVLSLSALEVFVDAGEIQHVAITASWADYRPWQPEAPYLYHLVSELRNGDQVLDRLITRFGFREVWIEGHRILLNGRPQRWYGEWCHRAHTHWLRPEYVRQWYHQLRDGHMNYVRMHTFPHPDYFLDIADEMGILICQETALHGSFEGALDTPDLWIRAAEHIRRMVRRDKNHPSLVLWSVGNEMRWTLRTIPSAVKELPRLRQLFHELDPTRPAYHEGDSALWSERRQSIISRHYGASCHGWGWWKRNRPLHVGELGRWHYGSPFTALIWAGDEVYADYEAMCRSIARDAARIIELGRAHEASCLFVWNTSGLDNFRPAEARTFTWPDPNTSYAKPLAHRPYESEYAWWQDGPGYRPGPSFELIRHAQRPLAIVIWQERTQFYTDRHVPHKAFLVNDLPQAISGVLHVRLEQDGRGIWEAQQRLTVPSGETGVVAWEIPLEQACEGAATIVTTFESPQGRDEVRRPLYLTDPARRSERLTLPAIGVWGESQAIPWLRAHGVEPMLLTGEELPDPHVVPILVVGESSVPPGSSIVQRFHDYVAAGGGLLVLEQRHSLFPGLELASMPTEMAHVRDPGHPVLAGISDDDLRFFGDDPFGMPSSDSWVTLYPYIKPTDTHLIRPLVDSSGGDFGTGGLAWAPVIEAQVGLGTVIAIQLRLMDRLNELPVGDRLLRNALNYLATLSSSQRLSASPVSEARVAVDATLWPEWPSGLAQGYVDEFAGLEVPSVKVAILNGRQLPTVPVEAWRSFLEAGGTAIVWELAPEASAYWQAVAGCALELFQPEHNVYQLIKTRPHPLTMAISNEDLCWLENWPYRDNRRKEVIVDRLIVVENGTSLLENAIRSGLDVLYGDDKASELERMPTMSAYFDAPPPRVGSGLVQLNVGKGQILFCQVRWRPEKPQFRRLLGLLLWNLGIRTGSDILAGERTSTAHRRSDGYPRVMRVARGLDEVTLADLVDLTNRQVEYCSDNVVFRSWPGWTTIETPDGRLAASAVAGVGAIYIGLEVHSSEPRKRLQTIGETPHPDLRSFLRLRGAGHVRVWANGAFHDQGDLVQDQAVRLQSFDLEAGANLVLLAWEPEADDAVLEMRFEDGKGQPEVMFLFQ